MSDTPYEGGVELVIFDLDGVLVDVQHAENAALAHLAGLMGLRLTAAESTALFSGRKLQECIDLIEDRSHTGPPEDAVRIVRETCERLIGPSLEPIAGVREALAGIDAIKCVASNSPPDIIRHRLGAAGIHGQFGARVYSAYDIDAWKPDPTLFLWAADDLGAAPERTVVVEDSAVGVAAALSAGMRVLHFCAENSGPHDTAVPTFSSMHMLPELIGRTG
ncbi:HAD-IA family hydrolase [Streptacidiphilus sp. N1-12]|uniref:HAD-IA family hydrolase n=2 Tax=Streptacidiphilus alkalitolerans TaxID=3342712 RepID=A0ABV6WZG7_9ACTN